MFLCWFQQLLWKGTPPEVQTIYVYIYISKAKPYSFNLPAFTS